MQFCRAVMPKRVGLAERVAAHEARDISASKPPQLSLGADALAQPADFPQVPVHGRYLLRDEPVEFIDARPQPRSGQIAAVMLSKQLVAQVLPSLNVSLHQLADLDCD